MFSNYKKSVVSFQFPFQAPESHYSDTDMVRMFLTPGNLDRPLSCLCKLAEFVVQTNLYNTRERGECQRH